MSDPTYSVPGRSSVGAVFLYHGTTLQMISALTGSTELERLGSYPITVLKNGNYLIRSPDWNGNRGAVILADGTAGVSGTVGGGNWLIGGTANDYVGYGGITVLENGNCVVSSPNWNGRRGAVTLVSGTTGISGIVGAGNSLVGNTAGDQVGSDGISVLKNGNYLVCSPLWNGNRGAVTWRNGTTVGGGTVGAGNSLVGSTANDYVGSSFAALNSAGANGIFLMGSGNYLVHSPDWNGMRGAVSWGSGTTGVSGTVGGGNSLVGSTPNDQVGSSGIFELENGNYVVSSQGWNGSRGAVTWGSGMTGVSGAVGSGNSLVGSTAGDHVGSSGVSLLGNGNYVVRSLDWNGNRGAVTWGRGTTGVSGTVGPANSLVGSLTSDNVGFSGIFLLGNGNYVVSSPGWNGSRGAATWGSGTSGVSGAVGAGNSLVGSSAGEQVGGIGGVYVLKNGNYVVGSFKWNGNRGAATWGSGTKGVSGTVGAENSLVGSAVDDKVGFGGIHALENGNYVVGSLSWNGNRGAATWGSGINGVSGVVGAGNSLVGNSAGDQVGRVSTLRNGNYVVRSPYWNEKRGAVTWGNGSIGVSGTVEPVNSLVGSRANDFVGGNSTAFNGITALGNGNYVVSSLDWNGKRGAVTWGSGTTGVTGTVGEGNSLVGTTVNDNVGRKQGVYDAERLGIAVLGNGDYVVLSPYWNGNWGAATWGSGTMGVSGAVDGGNSLVGNIAGDYVGNGGILELGNGNYLVRSPFWNGDRGAVTWGSRTMRVSGTVGEGNSLVGSVADDIVGSTLWGADGISVLGNGNYVVLSRAWNAYQGAVTWGNGAIGLSGKVNPENSVIGKMLAGGGNMVVAVDEARSRIIMGNPEGNRVSLMGFSPSEVWQRRYFAGSISNTGMMEDFDGDGVRNLFEFAFGTNPTSKLSGAAALQYEGTFAGAGSLAGTGQPAIRFERIPDGIDFRVLFVRRKDYAAAGLTYLPEFSADLSKWQPGAAVPTVMADDGTHQIVSVPYPASVAGKEIRFFRLAISYGP